MESERRRLGRHAFELLPQGLLSLWVDGRPVTILDVQDVSPFGIGLLVDGHVSNGCLVALQYVRDTTDIEVSGSVVWSRPADAAEENTCLGIYLEMENMAPNVEFFNAMTA
ncbi:MAG: hypothetical protein CO187_01130 [Zetaproteobacteria bacterium CG_4_9_14_3_um_filter_53_7]|nr:MAG: hypothetical protein CO187_01130 [Zetaproteobacteria bacterium CG_4_9_14_3_um_filter_53_7]